MRRCWNLVLALAGVQMTLVCPKSLDSYQMIRAFPSTHRQLLLLQNLCQNNASDFGLDCWKHPTRLESNADFMVPPKLHSAFMKTLTDSRIYFNIILPDIENSINTEKHRSRRRKKRSDDGYQPTFDFDHYHRYDTMIKYMYDVADSFPEFVTLETIGYSHEERPLLALKLVQAEDEESKRIVWVDGGLHAREWPSQHAAIYIIDKLIQQFQNGGTEAELAWYILPVGNPDGYTFSWTSSQPAVRLWRKNRSPKRCSMSFGWEACCHGVDLNRNFDYHWEKLLRTSSDPCHPNYAGTEAFSEPETRAIRDFLLERLSRVDAYISLHTYGQILLHPFGHRREFYPPDVDDLRRVAREGANAIHSLYQTEYIVGTSADVMYLTSGTSLDWAKKQGIKFSYLFELRPDRSRTSNVDSRSGGFFLEEEELRPTAEEAWQAVRVVARGVIEWHSRRS